MAECGWEHRSFCRALPHRRLAWIPGGHGIQFSESKLNMRSAELEQIASLLGQSADQQVALEETLRRALTLLNSETGTIHRLDQEKQLLLLTAQIGLPPFMLDIVKTIPVGKGIAGETVVRGGPVTMCNLQTDTSGVAKPV